MSYALIKRGIMVNTVNPGATDTVDYQRHYPEVYQAVLNKEPQGRWGQPEDAARLITWLVSDEAQWISGQVINSDGGVHF
jgi:3-oxoacyl-[acyl-carrier protein] reductase